MWETRKTKRFIFLAPHIRLVCPAQIQNNDNLVEGLTKNIITLWFGKILLTPVATRKIYTHSSIPDVVSTVTFWPVEDTTKNKRRGMINVFFLEKARYVSVLNCTFHKLS